MKPLSETPNELRETLDDTAARALLVQVGLLERLLDLTRKPELPEPRAAWCATLITRRIGSSASTIVATPPQQIMVMQFVVCLRADIRLRISKRLFAATLAEIHPSISWSLGVEARRRDN
jgi:hypothetical protein